MITWTAVETANGGGCNTGEARLASSTSNSNSSEGRLELCINNAWGTVCEDRFGNEDAAVACSQISGYSRQEASVVTRDFSTMGQGPIFLSDLNCIGDEANLLACMREDNLIVGQHNCNHSRDVAIRCLGRLNTFFIK